MEVTETHFEGVQKSANIIIKKKYVICCLFKNTYSVVEPLNHKLRAVVLKAVPVQYKKKNKCMLSKNNP